MSHKNITSQEVYKHCISAGFTVQLLHMQMYYRCINQKYIADTMNVNA